MKGIIRENIINLISCDLVLDGYEIVKAYICTLMSDGSCSRKIHVILKFKLDDHVCCSIKGCNKEKKNKVTYVDKDFIFYDYDDAKNFLRVVKYTMNISKYCDTEEPYKGLEDV